MGSENKICFLFQSTHPRRVWQCELFTLFRFWYVSIHTPTKGVTSESYLKTLGPWSFNPHTHEGCDTAIANSDVAKRSFNPHTHEGCDLATTTGWLQSSCFNPHTHEGCDLEIRRNPYSLKEFQSTHPRRVWLGYNGKTRTASLFQSTHPRRVWHIANEENAREIFVSIHTPTKGVTQTFKPHRVTENVSIHTPTKGVTCGWWFRQLLESVSIHTPTKGVTSVSLSINWTILSFNPHTHEGCDSLQCYAPRGRKVSIHTPTKGVTSVKEPKVSSNWVSIHTPTKGVTF